MRKNEFITLITIIVIISILSIAGSLAWQTSERNVRIFEDPNLKIGNIGVSLKYRSYMLNGTPIPTPVFYEWPAPDITPVDTPAPELPEYDPVSTYADRIPLLYPGGFYSDAGHFLDNAQSVIEYQVINKSGTDAIVRVNQKGLWFENQADPKHPPQPEGYPYKVKSVDLCWYRIKEEFFRLDTPPVSLINPAGSVISFLDYNLLTTIIPPLPDRPFSPYDIFNTFFYKAQILNMPSNPVNYDYSNIYGPDGFGLKLDTELTMDSDVRLAANGCAECFYLYMPMGTEAIFKFIFSALHPTNVNSVVKHFRNDWTYSVLSLSTDSPDPQDNPQLIASACEVSQEAFEFLFGEDDSYRVIENFGLNWISPISSPTPCLQVTRTPTPVMTLQPTKAPRPTITPTPEVFRFVLDTRIAPSPSQAPVFGRGNEVKLLIGAHSGNAFYIDWGDSSEPISTPELITNGNLSEQSQHTYEEPGEYNITLRGTIPGGISFADSSTGDYRLTKILDPLPKEANSSTTSLVKKFYNCTHLAVIPNDLFKNKPLATSFDSTFHGCSELAKLPANLFAKQTGVTNFNSTFYGCKALTGLPANLFSENTAVTSFTSTFYGCSELVSLPTDLFAKNTATTNFSNTFYGCSKLASLPNNLFAQNTAATTFSNTFYGCSKLASLPNNLFTDNTEASNFDSTFHGCTELNGLWNNMFPENTKAVNFSNTFYGCSKLAALPNELFAKNTKVTGFGSTFRGCKALQSIPYDLFFHNKEVTSFNGTFIECGLTSIPNNLFSESERVTSFSTTFSNCSKLDEIPEDLFSNCPNRQRITTFYWTFANCNIVTRIPEGLFSNCPAVTSFDGTFINNSIITSIPARLFSNCPNVTTFHSVFSGCGAIKNIPEGLFDNNTNVTSFDSAFYDCHGLGGNSLENGGIPENLFIKQPLIASGGFNGVFGRIHNLYDDDLVLRFANGVNGDMFTSSSFSFDQVINITGSLGVNFGSYTGVPIFGHANVYTIP